MKKIWIVFIIIILVICLDFITEKYTNKVASEMKDELNILKEDIENNKETNVKKLNEKWGVCVETLSLYQDHEELEKISTKFLLLERGIKSNDYLEVINSISEIDFLFDIMVEKQKLILKNIF